MTTDITDTFKTLSNEYRWQMLQWLKAPQVHFSGAEFSADALDDNGGVCVVAVTIKSGLAQSVVSGYLNALKQAGLVSARRSGKWTYYRYNAEAAADFLARLQQQL
ncbi:ArsR family transcriptional regulator [Chelonobacter oris]|uniref:ArsR family transcriptional regulator n=1 Tax=Chelonobacter oris TaxID=505317 RepID=A0A0A3AQJ5_9PAST|nr:helix-turn-helix transcriptional regulator [Chelonobacter oris]KGQ70052.1 ArsR family transcriptional regulator [Chelonobacter oris]